MEVAQRLMVGTIAVSQSAVIAERERIAHSVRLGTIHRLFGVGLKLQAMSLKEPDPVIAHRLEDCMRELDTAIADLRAIVFDLEDGHA